MSTGFSLNFVFLPKTLGMGLNLGGLCINRNLKGREDRIEEILGTLLEPNGTFSLEDAMSDWPNETFVDVYYSEQGTYILCDIDFCVMPYFIEGAACLSFVHIETSMSFSLNYTENSTLIREITEHEGEIMDQSGGLLPEEDENKDTSELIFALFEKVMGTGFWNVPPEAVVHRFKVSSKIEYSELESEIEPEVKQVQAEQMSHEEPVFDKMSVTSIVAGGLFRTEYNPEEQIEFFLRAIAYCQERKMNAFLAPISFKNTDAIVMLNLSNIRDVVVNSPHLVGVLVQVIQLEDLKWLARYTDSVIEEKTRKETFRKTMLIKTPYYQVPLEDIPPTSRWWKFWS
jgi:hypothetical protein